MRKLSTQRRNGFTLIELLVVIGLLVLFGAIGAATYFRAQASQSEAADRATVTKLQTLLNSRFAAVQEQVKDDVKKNHPGYIACKTWTRNDDVAQAVWMYLRTKNELPMSFTEAHQNLTIPGYTLTAKTAYRNLPTASAATPDDQWNESAVCLYTILTVSSAGGTTTDADGLAQQAGTAFIAGTEFPAFRDIQGTPIAFVRQCYAQEVNEGRYVRNNSPMDPFYPLAGKTLGNWGGITNFWPIIAGNVPAWSSMPAAYPGLRNFVPTVIGAGADKRRFDPDAFRGDNILGYRSGE